MTNNQKTQQNSKQEEVQNLLNPKIDYVFKRIFGHIGNEDITKCLLSSIISEQISEIELDCNPITEKDMLDDKVGILDIKAKLNNTINCNIEMQVIDKKDIEKRILFYWSKMYTSSIKQGEKYSNLEKGILILFTDYNLEKLKGIQKYITKWNIREEDNPKIILTDVLEIYIIELSKGEQLLKNTVKKDKSNLNAWLEFINNPEAIVSMENKEIKKAKEVLEEISKDKKERYLAELRQKYIMDKMAIEDAGYDKGLAAGIEQRNTATEKSCGETEGEKNAKIEISKKLKLKNYTLEEIMELTGLTKDEIDNV